MKRIFSGVAVLTLLLTMAMSTPVIAAPVIWDVYVGGTMTIQDAIDAASPGDTIVVHAGIYDYSSYDFPAATITKSNITLTGEPDAVLQGPGYEIDEDGQPDGPEAIYISAFASGVTIEGLSFRDYRVAILLDGSSGNLIQNNTLLANEGEGIYSFYDGINLANASNNQVIGNAVTDCEIDGIWLGPQGDEYGNRYGPGSTNNLISGNEISNCHGGVILDYSHNNEALGNIVSYSHSPEDNPDDHGCGIFVGVGATYNLVSGNEISNCGGGINLGYALFNEVINNTIGDSDTGIGMSTDQTGIGPSNNTVEDNTINDCGDGIWLMDAQNNQILDNTIDMPSQSGIFLGKEQSASGSTGNIVNGNSITGSLGGGINLDAADNNHVVDNEISDCAGPGIVVGNGSHNNLIKGSQITRSGAGIILRDGAYKNSVQDNCVNDSVKDGIFLGGAINNDIKKNLVQGSGRYGIVVVGGSSNNTIKNNVVSESGESDLFDDGSGTGNVWKHN